MLLRLWNLIKESYAGIFMSLCFSFMICFYEPINIFASNMDDFWFDFYKFFPIVLVQFFVSFIFLSYIFVVLRFMHKNIYGFFVVCFLIGLLCSYVQGNFLIGSLPSINGTWIDFDTFKVEKMISIGLWLVVGGIILFCLLKFKFKVIEKISKYSSLVIIAMLFSSLLGLLTTDGLFQHKSNYVATTVGFNDMSSDKNFIVFLLDAVDSKRFNAELKKLGRTETLLKDFTYYPDTLGAYPFTKHSIPLILSGKWFEHEGLFTDYFTDAIDNSELFQKLEDADYRIGIYEDEFDGYIGDKYDRFYNIDALDSMNVYELIKQEMKIVAYKYLPYQLKWRANISSLDLTRTKVQTKHEIFLKDDIPNYQRIKNEKFNIITGNNFQFIHLEGAHNPQRYDINLNIINSGIYENNLDACITILETYLKKLKDNNVYDNSVIVVMADHGYADNGYGRQNPILYIKGINEKHEYRVSDKKVSYVDLIPAFISLMNGDDSSKLFEGLDNSKRRYILYNYKGEDEMVEQIQTGNAWNPETMVDTGRVFRKH